VTQGREFKKLVRRRMRKTGESYTSARAHLLGVPSHTRPAAPQTAGRTGMFPFEKFTDRAKKTLTLAQEEAERAHHSYIGTEHLLLGLLREGDGLAARVLNNLGVGIDKVRPTIEAILGRSQRIIIQQIIPTSRVKKVIDIAFEQAGQMDNELVGTEHLLLGLMIEGEGVAAQVLKNLGVTLDTVQREIWRLLRKGGLEATAHASARKDRPGRSVLRMTVEEALGAVLDAAQDAAQREGAMTLRLDHLLGAMIGPESNANALLSWAGLDLDSLRRKLKPPRAVTRLQAAYWETHKKALQAAAARNHELAAQLREQEDNLHTQLDAAVATWRLSWSVNA
jgi:ATP-dependent Clp protease ATP-binding subunit ClpA